MNTVVIGLYLSSGFRMSPNSPISPCAGRRPPIHHRAVREVDEADVRRRLRGRLRERGAGRNHRVEQRQAERGSESPQNRAARQVLLGDEHFCS